MEKFYNNINELINNEGIKITSLERKIGASQGKGNMLKEGADAPHLEPKNWIEDDLSRYEGSHDRAALERVGLRLDEICKVRNISYSDLANLLEIERITLLTYIAGNRRVPASLLQTLILKMPEINPVWLLLGYGDIFNRKIIQ